MNYWCVSRNRSGRLLNRNDSLFAQRFCLHLPNECCDVSKQAHLPALLNLPLFSASRCIAGCAPYAQSYDVAFPRETMLQVSECFPNYSFALLRLLRKNVLLLRLSAQQLFVQVFPTVWLFPKKGPHPKLFPLFLFPRTHFFSLFLF